MKTITLSMSDFRDIPFSSENCVICDKWGICCKTIFTSMAAAIDFYDKKNLGVPTYFICKINWKN